MFADHELDAVADACLGQLMRTSDGVWMRFHGSDGRQPEVKMLSSLPLEVDILDVDDGDRVTNGPDLGQMAYPLTSLAPGPVGAELDVLPDQHHRPASTIKTKRPNGKPNIPPGLRWNMAIDQPDKQHGTNQVLQHKELIPQPPQRREPRNQRPAQHRPRPKAVLDRAHHLHLVLHDIGPLPLHKEIPAVHRARHKHGPAHPSVQPVQPLVTGPRDQPDDAALARQQVQQRHLHDGDPGVAKPDALPEEGVVLDGVGGHHADDDGPVDEEGDYSSEWWERHPGEP